MTDRHDSPDDLDPFEQQLRAHLDRRAATVRATAVETDTLVALRGEATEREDASRRRRVGALSVGSVAAAAVVIGLVLHAQSPQPLRSTNDAADAPAIAGVATGSSTGSATGGAKGWTSAYAQSVDPIDLTFPTVRPALPGTDDAQLSMVYTSSAEQGSGRPAAPLAVLARLDAGSSLQFVTASVQSPNDLGPGDGTEATIGDRTAQIIVDNNGWVRLIWDLDADHRVLVQSYGLDRATVERLATTLHEDETGTWVMDGSGTTLSTVSTPAPTEQRELQLGWSERDAADPATAMTTSSTNLGLVTGGAYEFWASLAGSTPSRGGNPTVLDIDLGDGATAPGVVLEQGAYDDGSTNASLDVLDPSGVVLRLTVYRGTTDPGAAPAASAADDIRAAAPAVFTRVDPVAWADLLARAAAAQQAQEALARTEKGLAAGVPTTVDSRGLGADGAPASIAPSPSTSSTTTAATTPTADDPRVSASTRPPTTTTTVG